MLSLGVGARIGNAEDQRRAEYEWIMECWVMASVRNKGMPEDDIGLYREEAVFNAAREWESANPPAR